MPSFYDRFSAFLAHHQLINNNSTVIAGVSGGVDSMVMLYCLTKYREEESINLIAAHLNHQIRGKAAEADETTVRNFCMKNNCDFVTKSVNVPTLAADQGISLEMAGRAARYRFFSEIAEKYPNSLIATAHTADDQVETILFRIFKGTGIRGLQGIPVRRNNIIRPLLFANKSDLYTCARENDIPFNEDHTNTDDTIPRNYIRQALIPSIKSTINPSLERSVLHLSEIFSDITNITEKTTAEALKQCVLRQTSAEIALDISRLKKYFNVIKYEVIRDSVNNLHPDSAEINFSIMERLVRLMNSGQTGRRQRISDDVTALVNRNELIIQKSESHPWAGFNIQPGKTYSNEVFDFQSEILNKIDFKPDRNDKNTEYVDLNKLHNQTLSLRPWQTGDRMIPLGGSQSKKISDIFIDQKVPLHEKGRIPILLSGDSIVWVCGYKLSDTFKIDSKTNHILKLMYRNNKQ